MPLVEELVCPGCGAASLRWHGGDSRWQCDACRSRFAGTSANHVDLSAGTQTHTSDHYSLQWSQELGFLQFMQSRQQAKAVMPAGQLGWDRLFASIRERAERTAVSVYDAACGFGGIAHDLITPSTSAHLAYVGADVHESLPGILDRIPEAARCALLVRWDISAPLPVDRGFDYVICRAAVHHTPDPKKTFGALVSKLSRDGMIAISAYRRKGPCREAVDDALRARVRTMSPEDAFAASAQFTTLGKALQQITERVEIPEDLPLLGIPRGTYPVQSLIYYYFIKCFHNPIFGDTYSTLVNYDWYHPEFAYRYDIEELREWFDDHDLDIEEEQSIEVQHFLRGRRRA